MTKLYDVPRQSWVIPNTDCEAPPEARSVNKGEMIFFDHIDGMYSFCRDSTGNVVHLPAWQDVSIVEKSL